MPHLGRPLVKTAIFFLFIFLYPINPVMAAQKYPCETLLNMAKDKISTIDPEAWIIKADYNRGDRELKFESANFIFDSPRLKKQGLKKRCLKVSIRNGSIKIIQKVKSYWKENPPNPNPRAAYERALITGFGPWWDKNASAWLFMDLTPNAGRFKNQCQGPGRFLWKIMGSGPGVNSDYILYLDAESMSVCRESVKVHNMDMEKTAEDLEKVKQILNKNK